MANWYSWTEQTAASPAADQLFRNPIEAAGKGAEPSELCKELSGWATLSRLTFRLDI